MKKLDSKVEATITSRFAEVARRCQGKAAVAFRERIISYEQLDRISECCAKWLDHQGVAAASRVYLDLDRSDLQIVALLGILKAGAIYVPASPDIQEKEAVFRNFGVTHIVTDAEWKHSAGTIPILYLNAAELAHFEDRPCAFPKIDREQGACVLSTSGTTGEPKGIMLPHRSHVSLVVDNWYCEFSETTRTLYHSPMSFDAATVEIWGSLLNGGCVAVSEMREFDPAQFQQELLTYNINTLWITAGIFSNLIQLKPDVFSPVDQVLTGGDVLNSADALAFKQRFPEKLLVNCWGPAENSTFSTCFRMESEADISHPLPIGTPVRGAVVHILDEHLRPLQNPMEKGEIYVAGDGLFLGYVGGNGQVAIETRHSPWLGMDLYPTGDLGVYRQDGSVQFLGRNDDLVKLAGKRIYLSEVNDRVQQTGLIDFCHATPVGDAATKVLDFFVLPASPISAQPANAWDDYHRESYNSALRTPARIDGFTGWMDSRTGRQIEKRAMALWLSDFSGKVTSLLGETYLDLGCGTGLILQELSNFRSYVGVDKSVEALACLNSQFLEGAETGRIKVHCASVIDFLAERDRESQDVVILNSLLQYLASKVEVKDVLRQIARKIDFNYLFVGDLTTSELLGRKPDGKQPVIKDALASLYELDFQRDELLRLLALVFPEKAVILLPKLCADAHYEFGRRYDALICSKPGTTLEKQELQRVVRRMPLQKFHAEHLDKGDEIILEAGTYENYIEKCEELRSLQRLLATRGVQLLAYFPAAGSDAVEIAVSLAPLELAIGESTRGKDGPALFHDPRLEQKVKTALKNALPDVPVGHVYMLYGLPTTARGKLDRESLKNILNAIPKEASLDNELAAIFGLENHELELGLYEAGVTSLQAVRASLQIRNRFDLDWSPAQLYAFSSIRKLVEAIEAKFPKNPLNERVA